MNLLIRSKHYSLLCFSLIFFHALNAQLSKPFAYVELSSNNIRAAIYNGGNFFSSPNQKSGYEFPKVGSSDFSRGTIGGASIWIAAYDENNVLHSALMTYRDMGAEFYPGPITSDLNASTLAYNAIYKVNQVELQQHKNSGYTDISSNIAQWPARDNVYFSPSRALAPYTDKDANNVYEPSKGDQPFINGYESAYMIFNDKGKHEFTNGLPLEVDVEAMFYSFPSQDTALNNTIFVSYSITNRSKHTYKQFFVSLWVDFDNGNYTDDLAGCDTSRNMFFGYNGDNIDENGGYGFYPPAQGVIFLNHQMNSFYMYENSNNSVNGNPLSPIEYYRAMSGLNIDGSAVKDLNNQTTPYIFSGEVSDSNAYNALNMGVKPSDIRGVGSIGPFTVSPEESICFDAAFIAAFQKIPDINSVATVKRHADIIQGIYDNGNDVKRNLLCRNKTYVGISGLTQANRISIYPNPGQGSYYINGLNAGQSLVNVYSIDGKLIYSVQAHADSVKIDLSDFPLGLYNLVICEHGQYFSEKLVKE